MSIRLGKMEEFDALSEFYQTVIADMRAHGLKQWEWGAYPRPDLLESDLREQRLYCVEQEGRVVAAFVLSDALEEEYAQIGWLYGVKPATLHRFGMLPDVFGTQLTDEVMRFVKQEAVRLGFDSLRLDTCTEDTRMPALYRSHTKREAGTIVFDDPHTAYACFETPLTESCPMLPIRMHPAYRYGDMTPWGGDALKTVYHKDIPDERTGESMEISAIPGLESRTDVGETLTELLRLDEKRLRGEAVTRNGAGDGDAANQPNLSDQPEMNVMHTAESGVNAGDSSNQPNPSDQPAMNAMNAADVGVNAGDAVGDGSNQPNQPNPSDQPAVSEFPLLLKLLAAKQPLSVQVHPDDAYAREHEGKLGKTEAWVILHAEEGASILYGIREGVTLDALRAALDAGEDIEPMIARVPAHAGDVFYMPSGMVHAIGGGILLYEIQQSSDVTYRLWDYNRTNDKGEKRPLHIRQSLDVIDPALVGARAEMPAAAPNGESELVTLLDVPAFRLECANVNGECELPPHPQGFRMLTALAGLLLSWQGDAMELSAGDSVLLPAACPSVTLMGVGRALVSSEGR